MISLRTEEYGVFLINQEFFGKQNNNFLKIPLENTPDEKGLINKFKRQPLKELIKDKHENNRSKKQLEINDEVEFDIFSDFSYENNENNPVQRDETKLASQRKFECRSKGNNNFAGKELDLDKTYGNSKRTKLFTKGHEAFDRSQIKDENKAEKAEQKLHILLDSDDFFSNLSDDLCNNSENIINRLSLPNNGKFQRGGIRMQIYSSKDQVVNRIKPKTNNISILNFKPISLDQHLNVLPIIQREEFFGNNYSTSKSSGIIQGKINDLIQESSTILKHDSEKIQSKHKGGMFKVLKTFKIKKYRQKQELIENIEDTNRKQFAVTNHSNLKNDKWQKQATDRNNEYKLPTGVTDSKLKSLSSKTETAQTEAPTDTKPFEEKQVYENDYDVGIFEEEFNIFASYDSSLNNSS